MIRAQPISYADPPVNDAELVSVRVRRRSESFLSRVLLSVVLAAIAALIPGEAYWILEAPRTWSDLFLPRRRELEPPRSAR